MVVHKIKNNYSSKYINQMLEKSNYIVEEYAYNWNVLIFKIHQKIYYKPIRRNK